MKPPEAILHIDIETFPRLGFYWDDKHPFNIIRQIQDTTLCCFSAKWHEGKQITKALPDYKGYKPHSRDDRGLVQDIWELLNEARVLVAHNGAAFDTKLINTRFTHYNLPPPSPYRIVDTLSQARKIGRYDSNRLNELGKYFGLGEKIRTGGADLWFDCMEGDKTAWNHMKKYNAQDVILLEKLYTRLLPYMSSHPNMAVGYGPHLCPKCGSSRIQSRGFRTTQAGIYRSFQCLDCRGWSQAPENELKKEDRPFKLAA